MSKIRGSIRLPAQVLSTERGVSVEERLRCIDWDFPTADDNGIHVLHPYPAKFISDIPRTLIQELGVQPATGVLDPFCGAGTTMVIAQELGHPSVGIDLNPIACLISKIKTTPLPSGFGGAALRVARSPVIDASAVPEIPNVDHWFSEEAKLAVASLIVQIDRVRDAAVRDHLRLALSSIIVRVSNQDSDTRYAAVEKHVSVRSVRALFLSTCARIDKAKRRRTLTAAARVIESDIMAVTPEMVGLPISLVVTSPPYPNAYEYWLYHKYRMWWLGYDPVAVKAQEIGARAHYFRKHHATFEDFRAQMATVLRLISSVLVPGGYACFVVGRSRIHGVDYDNASMIAHEGQAVGLPAVARLRRTIRAKRKSFNLSHARIKTEEVLVLRKTP